MESFDGYFEWENDSIYCYPGTNVLKNKLNIRDPEKLKNAERQLSSLRALELMMFPNDRVFDFELLKYIHRTLFSDIYDWAGEIRHVNISKGKPFCMWEYIYDNMNTLMGTLRDENFLAGLEINEFAARLAYYLSELNVIHPFRDGNGRTQRMFITLLARKNNYKLDLYKIDSEDMLDASIKAFDGDLKPLTDLIRFALTKID